MWVHIPPIAAPDPGLSWAKVSKDGNPLHVSLWGQTLFPRKVLTTHGTFPGAICAAAFCPIPGLLKKLEHGLPTDFQFSRIWIPAEAWHLVSSRFQTLYVLS